MAANAAASRPTASENLSAFEDSPVSALRQPVIPRPKAMEASSSARIRPSGAAPPPASAARASARPARFSARAHTSAADATRSSRPASPPCRPIIAATMTRPRNTVALPKTKTSNPFPASRMAPPVASYRYYYRRPLFFAACAGAARTTIRAEGRQCARNDGRRRGGRGKPLAPCRPRGTMGPDRRV